MESSSVEFCSSGISAGNVTCQPVGGNHTIQHWENHTALKRQMVVMMMMHTGMKILSLSNNFGSNRLRPTAQLTPHPVESQFRLEQMNCPRNCLLINGECFSVWPVLYWLRRRGSYFS